jgi:uncharacterized RDD family membrane protein YckC
MPPLDDNPYAAPEAPITADVLDGDGPPPASLGWRFVAFMIDYVILFALLQVLFNIVLGLTGHAPSTPFDGEPPARVFGVNVPAAVMLLVWTGYFALMESSRWQATLGKRLFRIRVVGVAGERISFGRAVGRALLKLLGLGVLYLGLIPALFTRRRQTLHDPVTGTLVVRGRS